ncbi:MAG: hypothetical protein R2759_06175 [Bacteroidales bacterium]
MMKRTVKEVKTMQARCRTIGDITCTGLNFQLQITRDIIDEIAATRVTERGGRHDKRSESAMEDRKKEGYFREWQGVGRRA